MTTPLLSSIAILLARWKHNTKPDDIPHEEQVEDAMWLADELVELVRAPSGVEDEHG